MPDLGAGFAVGHWTDHDALTGCTVVLVPPGNVSSCEVRGSSPSTRELEHLHPDRRLTEVHGILLTGGSAFGLAAADGVVQWLEERDIGYRTPLGPIPIVPGAVVFDLGTGAPDRRPRAEHGRAACDAARDGDIETGLVGAGTGCTVGKWAGIEHRSPGGLGVAEAVDGKLRVAALAVVNSVGDVLAEDGRVLAGTTAADPRFRPPGPADASVATSTVLVVLTVHASLDKREARWLAARGADGVTVAIRPAHTRYDGDVVFAVAAPGRATSGDLDVLGYLATRAVASAVREAVA